MVEQIYMFQFRVKGDAVVSEKGVSSGAAASKGP